MMWQLKIYTHCNVARKRYKRQKAITAKGYQLKTSCKISLYYMFHNCNLEDFANLIFCLSPLLNFVPGTIFPVCVVYRVCVFVCMCACTCVL